MRTLQLGNTGESVSSLSLGTMYFGSQIEKDQSFTLLDQYVDAGGSFLDTANNYAFWVEGFNGGESETVLGEWFTQRGNRSDMFLATKLGFNTPPTAPLSLAGDYILEEVDRSLARLQTDYIDLLYAHTDDRNTPLEETLSAFDKLVQSGKVRHIGCSNYHPWRIQQARDLSCQNDWPSYCCVQQRHTYMRPKESILAFFGAQVPVTVELTDYLTVNQDNFTGVAYSTLMGGYYARLQKGNPDDIQSAGYDISDYDDQIAALKEVAAEHNATLNQIVVAWIVQNTPPMFALVSSSSTERLQENLDADNITLTPEQLERLNSARKGAE